LIKREYFWWQCSGRKNEVCHIIYNLWRHV
jgi:hypothetical protein